MYQPNSGPWQLPRNFEADQPLVGFRTWTIRGDTLCSPMMHYEWKKGINVAGCAALRSMQARSVSWDVWARQFNIGPSPAHVSPEIGCSCGFYAWSRYTQGGELVGRGFGILQAWGTCIGYSREGFRAQYGRVLALIEPGGWRLMGGGTLSSVAKAYGIPIVRPNMMHAFAAEHGIVAGSPEWERIPVKHQ